MTVYRCGQGCAFEDTTVAGMRAHLVSSGHGRTGAYTDHYARVEAHILLPKPRVIKEESAGGGKGG